MFSQAKEIKKVWASRARIQTPLLRERKKERKLLQKREPSSEKKDIVQWSQNKKRKPDLSRHHRLSDCPFVCLSVRPSTQTEPMANFFIKFDHNFGAEVDNKFNLGIVYYKLSFFPTIWINFMRKKAVVVR